MTYQEAKTRLIINKNLMRRVSWSENESITLSSWGNKKPQYMFNHEIVPGSNELCSCLLENDEELGQGDIEAKDWQIE